MPGLHQGRIFTMRNLIAVFIAAAGIAAGVASAQAGNIIDEWASVKVPAAPALKPATVDNKTDALLVIDMVAETCNAQARPRCVETIPAIQKILNDARAKGMTVIYALGISGKEILPALAPKDGEPIVKSGADKFVNTELEKMLKDKGITGIIMVGTLAYSGVLHTASQAAFRGFKVVVPVDGMSSQNANTLYSEQYTAWHLANGPGLANNVTLTRIDMIKF
jgi:nicotinamidase-related amidase